MIRKSEFGFKNEGRTSNALFLARRYIDNAIAQRDEKLVILASDSFKAFGSISPAALMRALYRFGIPQQFIEMIYAVYSSRMFFVHN